MRKERIFLIVIFNVKGEVWINKEVFKEILFDNEIKIKR